MSDDEDDVKNRLGMRFDSDSENDSESEPEDDPEPEPEPEAEPEPEPEPEDDPDPKPKVPEFAADIDNVRETFDNVSIYIPEQMHIDVDNEYQRLAYETDWKFQKLRHYHPLLLYYGLGVIESLDGDEVIEYIRRMDQ